MGKVENRFGIYLPSSNEMPEVVVWSLSDLILATQTLINSFSYIVIIVSLVIFRLSSDNDFVCLCGDIKY